MTTVYAPPPGPPPGFHTGVQYAPPPGPPPPQVYVSPAEPLYPSCGNAKELATYVQDSLPILASQGWLSVPLPPDLESLYSSLFSDSAAFFTLPSDAPEKVRCAAPTGKNASDEGYSDIPGEKQLITIRRLSGIPAPLCKSATEAWDATGELFMSAVRGIAESLELDDADVFDAMSCEAHGLPKSERASSLLRLFRYNRPAVGETKKVVAEAHKDLGLLTLVIGQSPGLDARDVHGRWISVEDTPAPASTANGAPRPRLTATLLAGQTLTYLTRGLYASGAHRVSVRPASPSSSSSDAYRFSLVFALRPAPSALISTASFERSPLISAFPPERLSVEMGNFPNCSMYAQGAGELFKCIAQKHWNVNIAPEEREAQKRRLIAKADKGEKGEGDGVVGSGAENEDGERRLG
ncbi:hypothetical protein DFH06DRAFT_1222565 [Mycena polygramma]|nr:hypothetical protein DFH06DRAFT_1222565 [Mycena polygramma]